MNEILFALLIIISLLTIYCLSKILGKQGLSFSLIILNVAAFITNFKIVEVFKLNINIGIILFIATLSITYIYIIKFGVKEAHRNQLICLYTNIIVALLLVIMNYIVPSITETISINVQSVFKYNYKILVLYPLITLLTQYLIIKLYTFVTTIQSNVTINIILTYIITAVVYVIIYYLICYLQVLSIRDSLYIGLSTYIAGLIVTIINSIFIYYFVKSKKVLKWLIFF